MKVVEDLLQKINTKKAKIGVIGLGYVGLGVSIEFSKAGFAVVGFDIKQSIIDELKSGKSYINYIENSTVKALLKHGFQPTADFSLLSGVNVVLICVPTPLTEYQVPNLSFITDTAHTISKYSRKGQLVILESTTYPGTTREVLVPILESRGLKVGKDLFVAYSPERIDPGSPNFSPSKIPKLLGGVTPNCALLAEALYNKGSFKTVSVSSTDVAEAAKIYENIYRAVNIALVNELKLIFDRMGIDIWEVIDAASTKPFGFVPFYPGPGLGGHCIPIDPFYLTWKARRYEIRTRFIELAGEINRNLPYYVLRKISEGLNVAGKSLNGSKILVLGVSYKKDINDVRESPALKIISLLQADHADVEYNDPYVPSAAIALNNESIQMESVPLRVDTPGKYDCVVIVTDHSSYNWDEIVENSQLIVDTRNATRDVKTRRDKIIKA